MSKYPMRNVCMTLAVLNKCTNLTQAQKDHHIKHAYEKIGLLRVYALDVEPHQFGYTFIKSDHWTVEQYDRIPTPPMRLGTARFLAYDADL